MADLNYWRSLPLLNENGIVQMKVDRWLLQQHRLGKHPSTLRFYTWSPAAISLGYHQKNYPQSWQQLTWQGKHIDLVRRPTGGRAVLHQGDLSYTIVSSNISGNRERVYKTICQFLIEGMRSLGVELNYGQAGRGYIGNPNCFASATAADLIDSAGRKSIGSAQLRRGNAFLQHGSIFLSLDADLYRLVFNSQPNIALVERSRQAIIQALQQAARACFEIELVEKPLSQSEWQEILSQPNL